MFVGIKLTSFNAIRIRVNAFALVILYILCMAQNECALIGLENINKKLF